MTTYCFLISPRHLTPPFDLIPGAAKTAGFSTDDAVCPGEYLGDIAKDNTGHYSYCQRTASLRTRLTAENLREIAKQITRIQNAEEKHLAKGNPANRPTQTSHKKTAGEAKGY